MEQDSKPSCSKASPSHFSTCKSENLNELCSLGLPPLIGEIQKDISWQEKYISSTPLLLQKQDEFEMFALNLSPIVPGMDGSCSPASMNIFSRKTSSTETTPPHPLLAQYFLELRKDKQVDGANNIEEKEDRDEKSQNHPSTASLEPDVPSEALDPDPVPEKVGRKKKKKSERKKFVALALDKELETKEVWNKHGNKGTRNECGNDVQEKRLASAILLNPPPSSFNTQEDDTEKASKDIEIQPSNSSKIKSTSMEEKARKKDSKCIVEHTKPASKKDKDKELKTANNRTHKNEKEDAASEKRHKSPVSHIDLSVSSNADCQKSPSSREDETDDENKKDEGTDAKIYVASVESPPIPVSKKSTLYNNDMAIEMHFINDKRKKRKTEQQRQTFCSCKNSKCIKKYCVCFQIGIMCGRRCRCVGCKNGKEGKMDHNKDVFTLSEDYFRPSYHDIYAKPRRVVTTLQEDLMVLVHRGRVVVDKGRYYRTKRCRR